MVDLFKSVENEADAYWLGFIFADGNVFHNTLNVSQNDSFHLEKLRAYFGRGSIYTKRRDKYIWYAFEVNSKILVDNLMTLGCHPRKSLTLMPPTILDNSLISHFIRGYNDGDGGVYWTGQKKVCPRLRMRGTAPFLDWVKSHLPHKSSVYYAGPTAQLFSDTWKHGWGNINYLYQDSSIYLDRKYMVYEEMLSRVIF